MEDVLGILSALLLLLGTFFALTGAVGLFRFPDFFTRVHASSITDSAAAILVLGGLVLISDFGITAAKLLFILIFLLITSPTASHALAKAARHGGLLTQHEKNSLSKGEPN